MQLSYAFSDRGSLGMSYISGRESEYDARQYSLFGRYWFAHDWAVSAEALSRDTPGLFRLNDFRIGLQRRFSGRQPPPVPLGAFMRRHLLDHDNTLLRG